ncbi:MAG: YceH family protein [Nitrospirae bacterium]|nr:YceH family protein [Nitrospirota bacterium]
MDILLNDIEVRILGCLIEKEITTPDYYPLTLNALTNACNQKSNRHPVVSYEDTTVVRGLDSLREKGLAEKIYKADSRVPKYQHSFPQKFNLSGDYVAVLCELMLRGPQTVGEIRNRADRMYNFEGLQEVEEILNRLMEKAPPLVVKLPRQVGRKEPRFAHLLSGEPEIPEEEPVVSEESATMRVRAENERIAKLEDEIVALRRELDKLKEDFTSLKSQFE